MVITMARQISGDLNAQIIRPKARIMRILGDELVSSEIVAITELVKNAYDADATRVLVRFPGPLESGQGSIEVIDNGHGMSLETIRTTWMEPATLFRRMLTKSEKLQRRVLGEKGIGRFAASKLANDLEVVTRRVGMNRELRVLFDWTQFDDDKKYLDEIRIPWEDSEPRDICPTGKIRMLYPDNEPIKEDLTHGTILIMKGLRTSWYRQQLEILRTGLSRLVSPFLMRDRLTRDDQFQIYLQVPHPFEDLCGQIVPPEALERPHYLIKGSIDSEGKYDLILKRKGEDEEKKIGLFPLKDGRKPKCGPFYIELRVWERDRDKLVDLEEYNLTLESFRHLLDEVAGINIYRDGFRVLPYGEPRNDWLRLDIRRVQAPSMRFSNNQISGYILISADENKLLRDQSNREGLMEGQALDDLSELVKNVLVLIETKRNVFREKEESKDGVIKQEKSGDETLVLTDFKQQQKTSSIQRRSLFADINLSPVEILIKRKHPRDKELLTLVGATEKDIENRIEIVRDVVARYHRLATLGMLIDTVLHEGRAPLSKIGNEAYLGLKSINNSAFSNNELIQKINQRFQSIKLQSDAIAKIFRKIEPFGGRKRGRPVKIRLEQVIMDAFSVLDKDISDVGAKISFPDTDTQATVDQAEIQEVIINLLQNSLYWLHHVPKDKRQILVLVTRIGPEEVEIVFSDSGPGVDLDIRNRIFEPYFSKKPDGVGLGLTIAGEIINEYYNGSLELLETGPLQGATFRIVIRKRV